MTKFCMPVIFGNVHRKFYIPHGDLVKIEACQLYSDFYAVWKTLYELPAAVCQATYKNVKTLWKLD